MCMCVGGKEGGVRRGEKDERVERFFFLIIFHIPYST